MGFLWITCGRRVFEVNQHTIQDSLLRLAGGQLVELHVSDLINSQLPSQFDYTSWYDLLVFRRLAAGSGEDVYRHAGDLDPRRHEPGGELGQGARHDDAVPAGGAAGSGGSISAWRKARVRDHACAAAAASCAAGRSVSTNQWPVSG